MSTQITQSSTDISTTTYEFENCDKTDNSKYVNKTIPEIYEIYIENTKWFEEHLASQRALAKQRAVTEMRQKQFREVYKYEPCLKKKGTK